MQIPSPVNRLTYRFRAPMFGPRPQFESRDLCRIYDGSRSSLEGSRLILWRVNVVPRRLSLDPMKGLRRASEALGRSYEGSAPSLEGSSSNLWRFVLQLSRLSVLQMRLVDEQRTSQSELRDAHSRASHDRTQHRLQRTATHCSSGPAWLGKRLRYKGGRS